MNQPMAASQMPASPWESLFFWGPPGTGKTTAALMLHPSQRKLLIDLDDKGLQTIRALPPGIRKQVLANTDIWVPQHRALSSDKISVVRASMKDKVSGKLTLGYVPSDPQGYQELIDFINTLDDKHLPYHLIILDNLTVVDQHLSWLILNHHKASTLEKQHWGVYKQNMIQLVKGLTSKPAHRCIISHATEHTDDQTGETKVRPSVQGSYKDLITGDFSEVYYFKGRQPNGKYTITTLGNSKYVARTCKPSLAGDTDVDTMVKLYE